MRLRGGAVRLTVIRADGTIEEPSEPPDTLQSIYELAQRDSAVEKALRIYGSREHSWSNLFKIYEIVAHDVGGRHEIVNKGWETNDNIRNFKHTRQSVSAVGDDARHGVEVEQPPPNPMPLEEAEAFIEGLLAEWVRAKLS